MLYPVVIHKDRRSAYGVVVPDLPGCISAGDTIDEALANVREAIELHLEGMIEDGEAIPAPTALERRRVEYADATAFAMVAVDAGNLRTRAKRINITLPERILDRVDHVAKQLGESRSGLLAAAASEYVKHHPARA